MKEKKEIKDMPEQKGLSKKRQLDKKKLETKTKRVEARVRAAEQMRKDVAILESAGIVPAGKRFAQLKKLSVQKKFLAEPDSELVDAYYKTYRDDSKQGRTDRATIREKGVRKKRDYLYFTEICRYCPREVFFRIHMPEKGRDYAIRGLMLFDDGQLHHKEAQNRLERKKKVNNPERELILPEIGAVGYYDGLVPVDANGSGMRIHDIFEMKSKIGAAVLSFSQEDYDQGQLYLYAARSCPTLRRKSIMIRAVRIFNRDRALMIDDPAFGWIVDPDTERLKELLDYAHWLHRTVIVEKYLCPHPYTRDHAKCGWCRFNSWCWRGYPAPPKKQKIVAPDPKIPVPSEEILISMGKKFLEIQKEVKKLNSEKDEIAEVFLNYFAKSEAKQFPIQEYDRALAPILGQTKKIQRDVLLKALGAKIFAQIADVSSKRLESAVSSGLVTGDLAQRSFKYDPKKPYIGVVKIKEEEER